MSGEEESQRPGAIAMGWWSNHIAQDEKKKWQEKAAARGLSARLRRAAGPIAVLCEPAVHELARSLRFGPQKADRLVQLVSLLAEVREHDGRPLPKRLGGAEPVMSTARLEKLMRAQGEELTSLMRRAILMSERKCNVASLAEDLIYWNEKTRNRWFFDYFGVDAPREDTPDNGHGRAAE